MKTTVHEDAITGYTLASYSLDSLTCLIPPDITGNACKALREGQHKLPHPRLVCDGKMTVDRRTIPSNHTKQLQ